MKKGDVLIGIAVIFIMLIIGVSYKLHVKGIGSERYVNIYVERVLYKSIKLTDDTDEMVIVKSKHGINKIRVYNGGFVVIFSDCDNQYCVGEFVHNPGKPIICWPHHLKVIIEGKSPSNETVDGIS